MTKAKENQIVATTLLEVAKALIEVGAQGPCGYWNGKLAERLNKQAEELIKEARQYLH